jgi:hypothetical protein
MTKNITRNGLRGTGAFVLTWSVILLGLSNSACKSVEQKLVPIERGSQGQQEVPKYHRADHGFSGGEDVMVDLSELPGFSEAKTLADVAALARTVDKAIGFTAHPFFESGTRYAHAVISYTNKSPQSESWALYLFDDYGQGEK